MSYFLETVETIIPGVGFAQFDTLHFLWLAIFVIVTVLNCLWYRKMGDASKHKWRIAVAFLLVANEIFKDIMLVIGNRFMAKYLPLHLCSINIFLIAFHAWKPYKTLNAFLYTVCIPGAVAALLFPSWTLLPLQNFMHIHSFTVHICLAMYPIVLTAGGDFQPRAKDIPKCLLFLVILAIPILGVNLLLDTNFMFLMYPEEGNPLNWFAQAWGSHLLGFPVLIAAVLLVMYLPIEIYHKAKRSKAERQLPVG